MLGVSAPVLIQAAGGFEVSAGTAALIERKFPTLPSEEDGGVTDEDEDEEEEEEEEDAEGEDGEEAPPRRRRTK